VNDFLGQLNLTVQERRTVVGIFTVVIIVLNYLFVWPRFGEWSKINNQLSDMRRTIMTDNNFILKDTNPVNGWRVLVAKYAKLEGNADSLIEHPVDPQIQLTETIRLESRKSDVNVQSYNAGNVKSNAFFEEHSTLITIESQEPPLINFLFNMGNDPAMIRVGRLHLKPADDKRFRLRGEITLTANYSRKAPSAAAPAKPVKPGPKPATDRKTPPGTNSGPKGAKVPPPQPGPGTVRKLAPIPKPAPGSVRS
jgi:hypothetical protein